MDGDREELRQNFSGQLKDKRQGDILFNKRDEALFPVLYALYGDGKFTNQKFIMHAFRTLLYTSQLLQFISIIIDYSRLSSSTYVGEYSDLKDVITGDIYKMIVRKSGYSDAFIILFGLVQFLVYLTITIGYIVMKTERKRYQKHFTGVLRMLLNVMFVALYPTTFQLLISPLNCDKSVGLYYNYSSLCSNTTQKYFMAFVGVIAGAILWIFSLSVNFGNSIPSKSKTRITALAHPRVSNAFTSAMTATITCLTLFPSNQLVLCVTAIYLVVVMVQYSLRCPFYCQTMNWFFCGSLAVLAWISALGAWYLQMDVEDWSMNYLLLGISSAPVIFALGGRVASWRMEEINQTMNDQLARPGVLGEKFNWSTDAKELVNPRSLERLLKQQQSQNLKRGVWNAIYTATYFSTDSELNTRLLLGDRLKQDSIQWRKYVFLCRLIFANSIGQNPDEAMLFAHYACFIWFNTRDMAVSMELLRSAMGRHPGMDIRFIVYVMVLEIERYKQQYTSGGQGDIVTMLEFRKLHDKARRLHEICIRRLRNVWKTLASNRRREDTAIITHRINSAIDMIIETEKIYDTIKDKFPHALDVMKEYATFRRNAMSDFVGARELLQRQTNDNSSVAFSVGASSFHSSQDDVRDTHKGTILTRELHAYKVMRLIVWVIIIVISGLAAGIMFLTNSESDTIMTHATNLQTSFRMMIGGITAAYYVYLAEHYATLEPAEGLPDAVKALYMAEYEQLYEVTKAQSIIFLDEYEEYKNSLYELAQENDMTHVLSVFQDSGAIQVSGQNMTIDFNDLSIMFTSASRSLMELSFEEIRAINDTTSYDLAVIHAVGFDNFLPSLKTVADTQEYEVEQIIEYAQELIIYAGIGAGIVTIIVTFITIQRLIRRFGLFAGRTPAVTALARAIEPNTCRRLYNEMSFHHKNLSAAEQKPTEFEHMQQLNDDESIFTTEHRPESESDEELPLDDNGWNMAGKEAGNSNTRRLVERGPPINTLSSTTEDDEEDDEFEDIPDPIMDCGKTKTRRGLQRAFSDIKEGPTQIVLRSAETKTKFGQQSRKYSRPGISRAESTADFGELQDEIAVKFSRPLKEQIAMAFGSVYSRRICLYLWMTVTIATIITCYLCHGWFDVYRQTVHALAKTVDIRFNIRESVLHTALVLLGNEKMMTTEEALQASLELTLESRDAYRDVIFGTDSYDSWCFKDSRITEILFESECFFANQPGMYNGFNATCSNLDLYPNRDLMVQGMDSAIQTFLSVQLTTVYSLGTGKTEEPLIQVALDILNGADMTDIELGIYSILLRMLEFLDESHETLARYITILAGVLAVFMILVFILNTVLVLHKLNADIAQTTYFIKLLPWTVVKETPAIFQQCIQDDDFSELDTVAL